MKKEIKKVIIGMAAALLSTVTMTTVFAGTWVVENERWRYQDDMGRQVSDIWIQDGMEHYRIDKNGYLQLGWVLDNDRWYFLDTRIGGPQGKRMTGWQWIDGKCYYLDPAQNGTAAISSITPDGYPVDATGAWIDRNGTPYFEEGKGISSAQIVDIRVVGSGGAPVTGGGRSTVSGGGSGGGSSGGDSGSGGSGGSIYDEEWRDYSDSSVGNNANDFKNGNYSQMTARQREEVKAAIDDFKETYFFEGMSDFEKEIMIIRWLVDGCTYERTSGWENSTAYSCIINGRAQCSGYADAFLQTAKSCGLEVRYVSNSTHAWNLIQLDGDWYHVDVTWEDPIGNNRYGFSSLRNQYINLEDSEIRGIRSHRTWSPSSTKCNGSKYGPAVIKQYIEDGTIDTSKGESYEERANKLIERIRNEDGSNIIEFVNVESAAEQICSYMAKQIERRQSKFAFIVRYPSSYTSYKSGNYTKVYNFNKEIRAKVEQNINSQYEDILKYKIISYISADTDGSGNYFGKAEGRLQYADAPKEQYQYLIHYIDSDTKKEVGVQKGETERAATKELRYPSGYSYDYSKKHKINKGSPTFNSSVFQILGNGDVEMTIYVIKKDAGSSNPTKATPSSASEP